MAKIALVDTFNLNFFLNPDVDQFDYQICIQHNKIYTK